MAEHSGHAAHVHVLATMYDARLRLSREILTNLHRHFGDAVLPMPVHYASKLKEAASFGQPINEFDFASKAAQDFEKLAQSVKQAGQIRRGKKRPSRVFRFSVPDIKRTRERLHMSQAEFATMIGVSARTLQNWEQGRRTPEGPAQALLRVAAKNPEAVLEALHS